MTYYTTTHFHHGMKYIIFHLKCKQSVYNGNYKLCRFEIIVMRINCNKQKK